MSTYLVVGVGCPEVAGEFVKNTFGKAFKLAAEGINARFRHNSFDTSVMEIDRDDVSAEPLPLASLAILCALCSSWFYDSLTQCMLPAHNDAPRSTDSSKVSTSRWTTQGGPKVTKGVDLARIRDTRVRWRTGEGEGGQGGRKGVRQGVRFTGVGLSRSKSHEGGGAGRGRAGRGQRAADAYPGRALDVRGYRDVRARRCRTDLVRRYGYRTDIARVSRGYSAQQAVCCGGDHPAHFQSLTSDGCPL